MSRTIGDRSAKVVAHASVIAKSELTMTELDARSLFLVLASDGLWDVMSSNDAVQFVFQRVREQNTPPREVAKLLVDEALRRGYVVDMLWWTGDVVFAIRNAGASLLVRVRVIVLHVHVELWVGWGVLSLNSSNDNVTALIVYFTHW